MWLGLGIMGGVMQGGGGVIATELTASINDSVTIIPVASTNGFPTGASDDRSIVIGSERITYLAAGVTATEFGTVPNPVTRGATVEGIGTEAAAHSDGSVVYTRQASRINQAMDHTIAVMSDASGLWGALTVGVAILQLLGQFFTAPMAFLGTDLAILTYIWAAFGIGALFSIGLSMAGSRRV